MEKVMFRHSTSTSNCYPPTRAGDVPYRECGYPSIAPHIPSVAEQMGTDPISKLAAAIEKLAEALREGVRD